MGEITAEQFARRAFNLNLITERELHRVWTHFGTHDVPVGDVSVHFERLGLLTNWQVERLIKGETAGFFYGDYKVLYFVGNGSFARVYRAAHKDTQQVVALKVLRKRFSDEPGDVERFLREGKVGTTLRHPNIVPIYEVHSVKHTHFLVMAFVEGQSLRDFVRIRKRVEPLEAAEIISGIVAGLVYGAEKGITHRDIKLSNVLISSDGQPQIVDFGLAAVSTGGWRGENYTNASTIDYGTLAKISGVSKDDPRSDIFFTGCMLYHMLAGQPAMPETRDRAERARPQRFREIVPIRQRCENIPLAIEGVVNKSMELDADRRYAKPVDMLLDLRRAIKALKSTDSSTTASEDKLEGKSKTILVIESNTSIQSALREALKKRGYRVLVLSNPERAWDRIQSEPTLADAAIVSTVSLGKAALSVFQQLTQDSATAHIPTILLLGKNQTALMQKLQLASHQRALAMPLKMAMLRDTLIELLTMEPPETNRG